MASEAAEDDEVDKATYEQVSIAIDAAGQRHYDAVMAIHELGKIEFNAYVNRGILSEWRKEARLAQQAATEQAIRSGGWTPDEYWDECCRRIAAKRGE